MTRHRYLSGVSTLALDAAKCTGCGFCLDVCPHEVFQLADKKAVIADLDACMECGACALNCPTQALLVESGVGCAQAIVKGAVTGTEPTCGCENKPDCC
ncbi:MAG: mercury methylation ferredoxin HgcB [Elusimicrobiota bacterium]